MLALQAPTAQPTVLVVDDDARSRAVVCGYLRHKYSVHEADGGAAALAFLEQRPVDLVLLDVMMPGMSGFDTCREIKLREPEAYRPVLLLTALSDQADRNRGLAAGADDFLVKPVDRRELDLRVAAFLRLRQQEETIRLQLLELQRLVAVKDELMSLIVHDVGNSLNSVQLNLRVLSKRLSRLPPNDLGEVVLRASDSAKVASERVADVLQVRMMEEAALRLQRTQLELRGLLEGVAGRLAAVASEARVALRSEVDGDHALPLDQRLVQRAVENLVINAIQHSPEGGEVSLCGRGSPEGWVVEVVDQGPGVPDPIKQEVFEKFRTQDRTGRGRRGHGLGLYMVRLTANLHGGTVEVADRPGGGAVFRLQLPAGGEA